MRQKLVLLIAFNQLKWKPKQPSSWWSSSSCDNFEPGKLLQWKYDLWMMVLHHRVVLNLPKRTTNTHCGAGTPQKQLRDHVNKAKGWLRASNCLQFLSASSLQLCSLHGSFCAWFLGFFPSQLGGGGVGGEERAHKALVWESPDTCTCSMPPGTGQASSWGNGWWISKPLTSKCKGSFAGFVDKRTNSLPTLQA